MPNIKKITFIAFAGFVFLMDAHFSVAGAASQTDTKAVEQYKKKLAYYLKQEQQDSNPRVIYNLGVIYYKLKQYPQANTYFRKLLSVDSYHLIAKYNLGLVAYKSGNTEEAIRWFKEISAHKHKFNASEKIIKLANAQLLKLNKSDATSRPPPAKPAQLKNYVYAYYGYDDNLIDPNGNVLTGDSFLNVYGSLTFDFASPALKGVSWKFGYYSKDYSSLDGYDYKMINTDFGKLFKQGNWRHGVRLRLDSSTYGALGYQSVTRTELKTQYINPSYKLTARYRYYNISSEDVLYDAYEGSRQHLYLNYDWLLKAHRLNLGLSFENNDRADLKSATGTALSYSPEREQIEFSWIYTLNEKWQSRLKYEYRDSLYNDFSEIYNVVREETLTRSSLQVKYRLDKNWWLMSDLSYSDNQSNIIDYSYTRNVIRIGISGSF